MAEYQDVIKRLRLGHGVRAIQRNLGVHRTIVRTLRELAELEGWLAPESPLPSEERIQELRAIRGKAARNQAHPLDRYKGLFRRWVNEEYSYVVMHHLIQDRYTCSEATVRRYVQSRFSKKRKPVMRRPTLAGEVMEVDFGYLGITYAPDTYRRRKTYLFSGRLVHSRLAYREIVFDQSRRTFFVCHMHAFEYFGGVPARVRPDNLKAAVTQASYTDPLVNRAYRLLAEHYGFLIDPCAPYTPEHKGGVESDIKYVKGNFWPIFKEGQTQKGRETPYADELPAALERWTTEVSETRTIAGLGRSPRELFETEEAEALKPLPAERWDPVSWAEPTVGADWRVSFEKGYYSVPYRTIGRKVRVLADSTTVRIYLDCKEIATHHRVERSWGYARKAEHAPPEQEAVLNSSQQSLTRWAHRLGLEVGQLAEAIFSDKAVDGIRPVRALIRLADKHSVRRLQAACRRALFYQIPTYRSVKAILSKGLDLLPLEQPAERSGQLKFRFQREAGYFDPASHPDILN